MIWIRLHFIVTVAMKSIPWYHKTSYITVNITNWICWTHNRLKNRLDKWRIQPPSLTVEAVGLQYIIHYPINLEPFLLLHFEQHTWKLSCVLVPPNAKGTMWSTVATIFDNIPTPTRRGPLPQKWQWRRPLWLLSSLSKKFCLHLALYGVIEKSW